MSQVVIHHHLKSLRQVKHRTPHPSVNVSASTHRLRYRAFSAYIVLLYLPSGKESCSQDEILLRRTITELRRALLFQPERPPSAGIRPIDREERHAARNLYLL